MKIGELASLSGTQVETIRYYEAQGLLPEPARSEGNYRLYGPQHAELLLFIRHCRSLDMSLDEVRVLLRLRSAPAEECADVNVLIDEHIDHVVRRIKELRSLERQLRSLRARCATVTDSASCGILSELSVAASREMPAAAPRTGHLGGVHAPKRKR